MIKTLEIKNFKSIKQLKLECKKINILIGEPNTGKSNILETLGLLSYGQYYGFGELQDFVRFERTTNLFCDEFIDEPLDIKTDLCDLGLQFANGRFGGNITKLGKLSAHLEGGYDRLRVENTGTALNEPPFIKFYRFIVQKSFNRPEAEYLLPPHGGNLLSLLFTKRELRSTVNEIFSRYGLRLVLKPQENKIEVIKQLEDVIVSYPYSLTSDTLQRIIFNLFAVLSNQDSIITFEEPESHAFPYYTKYFAETIALDDRGNQYFISTHNPYLLLPILAKAPKEDVAVFITYFKDYQTKVKLLSAEEVAEIMEIDVFSNLDRFLEGR